MAVYGTDPVAYPRGDCRADFLRDDRFPDFGTGFALVAAILFSLAQIGEFAFIIAALGLTLGVTSSFLYPVAVAVSVITTFTTPFVIKQSEPAYRWLEGHLPRRFKMFLARYSAASQSAENQSAWRQLLKRSLLSISFTASCWEGWCGWP